MDDYVDFFIGRGIGGVIILVCLILYLFNKILVKTGRRTKEEGKSWFDDVGVATVFCGVFYSFFSTFVLYPVCVLVARRTIIDESATFIGVNLILVLAFIVKMLMKKPSIPFKPDFSKPIFPERKVDRYKDLKEWTDKLKEKE